MSTRRTGVGATRVRAVCRPSVRGPPRRDAPVRAPTLSAHSRGDVEHPVVNHVPRHAVAGAAALRPHRRRGRGPPFPGLVLQFHTRTRGQRVCGHGRTGDELPHRHGGWSRYVHVPVCVPPQCGPGDCGSAVAAWARGDSSTRSRTRRTNHVNRFTDSSSRAAPQARSRCWHKCTSTWMC